MQVVGHRRETTWQSGYLIKTDKHESSSRITVLEIDTGTLLLGYMAITSIHCTESTLVGLNPKGKGVKSTLLTNKIVKSVDLTPTPIERRVSRAAQWRAASPASCGRRNKQKHKKRPAQQSAGASRRRLPSDSVIRQPAALTSARR